MATPTTKAPVLNGPDNWHDWLDYIKDLSTSKRVWAYVDPSLDAVPGLVEPTVLSIHDVMDATALAAAATAAAAAAADGAPVAPRVTIMDLDENQRAALGILQRTYTQEFTLWQMKDTALQHINDVIKATTGQHYQAYITGVTTPYERLKALAKRLSPTDTARYDEVRDAYRASLTGIKRTAWEMWLHGWEKALKDGQRLKIPEVQGSYPTRDFLTAVAPVSKTFTDVQEVENNKLFTKGNDLPDALDISAEWRNYMLSQQRSARGNAFGATLQGQGPNGSHKPKCVCGQRQWYSECPYIFPEIRPDGWKPDPQIEKRVKEAIATNEKVRQGIEKAKEKRSASLASSASPAPLGLIGAITKVPGPTSTNAPRVAPRGLIG